MAAAPGRLIVYGTGPQHSWDPQRMLVGAEQQFAGRVFLRTLTTFTSGPNATLVPDLATDLGTMSDNGRTWRFTLKEGAAWQDGKPVTCEDVTYGLSRAFDPDIQASGASFLVAFLDIPTKNDSAGSAVAAYNGPFRREGQEFFDKAVACAGRELSLTFKAPWTDFNIAATLPAYAPVRADRDGGALSNLAVFSNGPYQLQSSFDKNTGGTFVRNAHWVAESDAVRKAIPDTIDVRLGLDADEIYRRVRASVGDDAWAVPLVSAPASVLTGLDPTGEATGAVVTASPYVDYLVPNYRSPVFANEKARQAFAMATNRDAYVTSLGGQRAMTPTMAMCHPYLACHRDMNPFGVPYSGDVARAKDALAESGLPQPVAVRVAYRQRPDLDAAMAALKAGWDQAGFEVTLDPVPSGAYYATIRSAQAVGTDVFWASWRAEWPSGSTVIGTLFDSRLNVTAAGSGADYGYFNDAAINARIDQTHQISDRFSRELAWGELDAAIAAQGGHIVLANHSFTFLAGSRVTDIVAAPLLGGYVDLAPVGLR